VGDLFLTCSSPNSRNYTVGYRLGKGESLQTIVDTLGSVAEGVTTTKGVKHIVDELKVNAPIISVVSCSSLVLSHLAAESFFTRSMMYSTAVSVLPFTQSSVLIVEDTGKDIQVALRELLELPPSRELQLPPRADGPARRVMKKLGLE